MKTYKQSLQESYLVEAHTVKVGDIFYSSWGYDQTNVDFYQVTAVGTAQITIQEIAGKEVANHQYEIDVMPVPGAFKGQPMKKLVNTKYETPAIKISSYATAYLWDGKPKRETAAGYGH